MLRTLLQATILVALSAGAAVLTHRFHPRAPALHLVEDTSVLEDEVTISTASDWESQGGVLWIDARVRTEYEKEHIPGALLISEQELDALIFENLDALQANTKPIVVYCDGQKCDASRKVAEKLRDIGLADVKVLKGGWQAWQARAAASGR